jgi:TolB-like protein/DNA-binding winged helix-turn-helix (wHTH) protein/Flp pilus assembly protein TadD
MLDEIRVDPAALSIDRDGEAVRVEAKVMQVLLTLANAGGDVVSRAAIEQSVWPGRVVTDDTVTNAVVKLRKALKDNPRQPRVVETIAKRGYRLLIRPRFEAADPTAGSQSAANWQRTGLLVLLLVITAAIGALLMWNDDNTEAVRKPVASVAPSIAVIPLNTLGDVNTERYFAEGITLDLITELSRVPGLLVISPDTAFEYRERSIDDRTVGTETGVSYLVRGGVQRSAERLRINVRLVETESGSTLWAERFDGTPDQIFRIQDRVVSGIAIALRKQLGQPFLVPRRNSVTRSVAAYDAFLHGQERYGRRTPADNREAQAHFEHAVDLDPTFARAFAGLALTWSRQAIDGWTDAPEEALIKAYELANTASNINSNIPQVHFVLGQVLLFRGQHEQAATAASTAIELNPNYADAYALLAWVLHYSGRTDQALNALQEGLKRNPNSSASYHEITGEIHFATERYRQAVQEFQATLARNPTHMRARLWLAASYMKLGQHEQAAWEVQEVLNIHPGASLSQLPRAFPLKDPRQLDTLTEALRRSGLPNG